MTKSFPSRMIPAALAALVLTAACSGANEPEPLPELNIVETAVAAGTFNTLVAALEAAGLDVALTGDGPFTVFAPTDEAFGKLPEGTVEALLNDIPTLTDILLYHVVDGHVLAADVAGLSSATTLQGEAISIEAMGGVMLNGSSNVVTTDILATNGVIHVIDEVLLPPSMTQ